VIRFLNSGESHGKCLNAIIEGLPVGLHIDIDFINSELKRRKIGYGRGGRMAIEDDFIEIKSGVRFAKTIGSPVCIEITNKDFENWKVSMSADELDLSDADIVQQIKDKEITRVRPGHADLTGYLKYNQDDVRNVLERSSARETASRVAVGAICKLFLKEFGISGFSCVTQIGRVKVENFDINSAEEISKNNDLRCPDAEIYEKMKQEIDEAKENGDTLGGEIKVIFNNLPIGLGSYVHWDKKIDGQLAQALMSIQAVKAVEFGLGKAVAETFGSQTHDEIFYENAKYIRKTNNAGGVEGGMTNGEPLVITLSMKAIPTMKKSLNSVDIKTHTPYQAHFERSDTCAVSACGVVAESMVAYVLANAILEKFGSDNIDDIKSNYQNYLKRLENA